MVLFKLEMIQANNKLFYTEKNYTTKSNTIKRVAISNLTNTNSKPSETRTFLSSTNFKLYLTQTRHLDLRFWLD